MKQLLNDTLCLIDQGFDLLTTLSSQQYCHSFSIKTSSIGAHYRHIMDHYSCFLYGLPFGVIDYDKRERSSLIENSLEEALSATIAMRDSFRHVDTLNGDQEVRVAVNSGKCAQKTISSLSRELQFLCSHTIHHFAIIKLLGESINIPFSKEFGIAPSTLEFEKSQCVR